MDELWKIRDPYKLPGTPYTVVGYSVAAVKTSFFIPELKLMLDSGLSHGFQPEHIFITHLHMDHSLCLPNTVVQLGYFKTEMDKKPTIYVPERMVDKTKEFMYSVFAMSKNNPNHRVGEKYNIMGVKSGLGLELELKKKLFSVQVIHCDHTVPCVGYGFSEIRKKLKDEYKDMEGKDIGQLRKSGVEVSEDKRFPVFCYLGDTSIAVFKDETIFDYPNIFVECSFVEEEDKDHADEKKHIYWGDLEQIIKEHPNNHFILYHFSQRYGKDVLEPFFAKYNYPNVYPWIC